MAAAASKSSSGRAGVVEEDVEAAVLSLACGEEPLDRSGVGQVGGRHERRQAARRRDQAGRLLQRRLSPACEHQRTTRLRASKAAQKSIQALRLRRKLHSRGIRVRINHNRCILQDLSLRYFLLRKNNLQDKLPRNPCAYN